MHVDRKRCRLWHADKYTQQIKVQLTTTSISNLPAGWMNAPAVKPTYFSEAILYTYIHGRPQGGQEGHLPPPWNLKKMTSYAAVLRNTLNFWLASSALAIDTLYFNLKQRKKNAQNSFATSARRKMVNFLYGAPKTCQQWFCPPLWKNFYRSP